MLASGPEHWGFRQAGSAFAPKVYVDKLIAVDPCSALRNRAQRIIGLTCRVGRHMAGTPSIPPPSHPRISSFLVRVKMYGVTENMELQMICVLCWVTPPPSLRKLKEGRMKN